MQQSMPNNGKSNPLQLHLRSSSQHEASNPMNNYSRHSRVSQAASVERCLFPEDTSSTFSKRFTEVKNQYNNQPSQQVERLPKIKQNIDESFKPRLQISKNSVSFAKQLITQGKQYKTEDTIQSLDEPLFNISQPDEFDKQLSAYVRPRKSSLNQFNYILEQDQTEQPTFKTPYKKRLLSKMNTVSRRIKHIFHAIRAAVRIDRLYRPKQKLWQDELTKELKCTQYLQYHEKQTSYRIKQWCLCALTKVISVIRMYENEKSQNFIDEPQGDQKQKDHNANIMVNITKFLLDNLELMTRKQFFLQELGVIMFKEQFLQSRECFSLFVSKRTKYLSQLNKQISSEEKELIFAECVIMTHLTNNIISLSEKQLDVNNQGTCFKLRCLLSIIQYLFLTHFKNLKPVYTNPPKKVVQRHLARSKQFGFSLIKTEEYEGDELIRGLYKNEQLAIIYNNQKWMSTLQQKFAAILCNLIKYTLKS